jgi:undecaprenyl diphosphate synthase
MLDLLLKENKENYEKRQWKSNGRVGVYVLQGGILGVNLPIIARAALTRPLGRSHYSLYSSLCNGRAGVAVLGEAAVGNALLGRCLFGRNMAVWFFTTLPIIFLVQFFGAFLGNLCYSTNVTYNETENSVKQSRQNKVTQSNKKLMMNTPSSHLLSTSHAPSSARSRINPTVLESLGLDPARIPAHIAIIMDGNGRWAKERSRPRLFGHHQGYMTTREIVRASSDLGVDVLTLYAFSTENWSRPATEVDGLMRLFLEGAKRELEELHNNNVQMRFSGRLHELPQSLQAELACNVERTKNNTGLILNICLNYGARAEIIDAVKSIAERVQKGEITPDQITAQLLESELYTGGLPDPDLLIRTAGEMRLSNYLLWQIAYSEIYVTDECWPAFSKEHLIEAIRDYQRRTRKFGGLVNANANAA